MNMIDINFSNKWKIRRRNNEKIIAYGTDEMGLDTAEAFVFGGYVKEIKASELEKTDRENKEKLKQSIRRLGGTVY